MELLSVTGCQRNFSFDRIHPFVFYSVKVINSVITQNTHTHTPTHTHTHTHTHTPTHIHTNPHTHTHTPHTHHTTPHKPTHTHRHTHTHAPHTHTPIYRCIYIYIGGAKKCIHILRDVIYVNVYTFLILSVYVYIYKSLLQTWPHISVH